MKNPAIQIRGARQHNLKGIDVEIPLNRITVITGVSGSGKSSLAFDTLYAEGQRRYVETFSPYARQFMDRMDRPLVDKIEGIPPAIAIDRKDPVRTSRSTVGTMTEITDYVKLLFARRGQLFCKSCSKPVKPDTPEQVWQRVRDFPAGSEVIITFPVPATGLPADHIRASLVSMGYDRYFQQGTIAALANWAPDGENSVLNIVADRIMLGPRSRGRILDSAEMAFRFGHGRLDVWINRDQHFACSSALECAGCRITYNQPIPNLFSFNSPIGACETCRGFGRTIGVDLDLVIPDPDLSLSQGAIRPWGKRQDHHPEFGDLQDFCRRQKIPMNRPFRSLDPKHRKSIIEGTASYYGIAGFFEWLESKTYKMPVRVFLSRYRSYDICAACKGTRFKEDTMLYRLAGQTIAGIYALNVVEAIDFFQALPISKHDKASRLVLAEIRSRLNYLQDVGLGYLTLDRQSRTLSGGEVQRVSLASALGSSLVNTLYVLDEPSIGLHPRDNHRLVRILQRLRDLQNTVVVVEHDPEIIRESDFLLDLGPRAGEKGGQVMYFGPTGSVNGSLTGQYLKGQRRIPIPDRRRKPRRGHWITIEAAAGNNLKKIDVRLPLGLFVCLTGVSGSGKSTLAEEILYKAVKRFKGDSQGRPGKYRAIRGLDRIQDVVLIDQQSIGRTPRANPLTYTKALEPIRRLIAGTPDARAKKLGPGHFSFNVAGGRCETCKGDGYEKVEMQFLSDVFITCPDCRGKRFKQEVLDIQYRGLNIHDILTLTVDRALMFFDGSSTEENKITAALKPLTIVGLGYLRLGQPINTLSGGEAQRLKLSRHLRYTDGAPKLFIFDEPTTGLHFDDIAKLLVAFQRLVAEGNTVLVIEHNMDVIKTADWVIDLGPEGGDDGGRIVAYGPPEQLASCRASHTGQFLKAYLSGQGRLKSERPESAAVSKPVSKYDGSSRSGVIAVSGAREHNLQNLDLAIPRNQLVALTGVSGSGKSSLAFDILFAEGQRRYLESLAPYVRQYMRILERPEVDRLTGISPTVAIEQRISHSSRRSTVGILTEIYHFLRLLFSKLGTQHCPGCSRKLIARSQSAIEDEIMRRYRQTPFVLLALKISGRKGFHKDVFSRAMRQGFTRARIDGEFKTLHEGMASSRYNEHTIEVVVGEFGKEKIRANRLRRFVDTALKEGEGSLTVLSKNGGEETFSLHGTCPSCGIGLKKLDPRLFSFNSKQGACPGCGGLGEIEVGKNLGLPAESENATCPQCGGSRLNAEALAVKIGSYSIWDLVKKSAGQLDRALRKLRFQNWQRPVADPIVREILSRLFLLNQLGLSYLSLGRSGDTLSGGEAQRVRLAAQLGSNLTGVCYILDEPTIGLHPRDNRILIEALKLLKTRGNSILVVEHDEETIKAADTIIDLGPGAGQQGGRLVASGTLADLKKEPLSITGGCLDGHPRKITSRLRPLLNRPVISIRGAHENNLKQIDLKIPLGLLICVTGVSGSGKSTLVKDTLYHGIRNRLLNQNHKAGLCKEIKGWKQIDRIREVDHSPIGRTPRSVPASYVGFLDDIRKLFAGTPDARSKGFKPGRFSFNLAGGRCEACKGQGRPKVTMSFLPDVYVPCELCRGSRFNKETLSVRYKGKSIAEVLELTFAEAATFFAAVPAIRRAVQFVCDIGLGYLQLGQPSPTLSGGEAQRIKLARQLVKPSKSLTFYILDEPTTGLHVSDIQRLLDVLQVLVDQGNTIAVIEHNMEVIKEADYIIDLGPEGGDDGGYIVATGSPAELLSQTGKSHTARYLNKYLTTPEI
ncbi:MAG: excinuclease ABC subunit UvrA [Desulfobacterales bacterium]|jgi:excinuclease ABC subunit A